MDLLRTNVFGNYNFRVYVDNIKIGFSKVSSIETTVEMEEFTVGGFNISPYFCAAPKKSAGKLVLERGMCRITDRILRWKAGCELENGLIIFVEQGAAKRLLKCYAIDWGIITKWEASQLDSMGNEILINKFEVVHTGITESLI